MSWAARVAAAASVGTGVIIAAGVLLAALEPTRVVAVHLALGGFIALAWAVLAPFVARSAPGNLVAVLFGLIGFNVAATTTREIGWHYLAARPDLLARSDWLAAGLRESAIWLFAALALLLLYFPEGRLPSRRWRPVAWALVAAAALHHAWGIVATEPFRPPLQELAPPFGPPPAPVEVVSAIALFGFIALLLASAAAPVARFRRSSPRVRRQIKWLAVAGFGVPGFLLVCGTEILLRGESGWVSMAVGLATVTALPVATGIAMLRHDLYDVDRALAGAVTYGLLTTVLVLVFTAALFAGGLVLGRGSAPAAVAATALTALALTPLRTRVQAAVDRRVYPLRRAALAAVEDLRRRIHAGSAEPESLEAELRLALRDPDLRVGYRVPRTPGFADADGRRVDTDAAGVPVVLGDAAIGLLRPGSGPASPELLRAVAEASAVLVEVVRLRLELTSALREVEASRSRLVQVGDRERRQLERDLHDGAQQRLVSLGMALRLAQRQLAGSGVDVQNLLDEAVAEIGTAVAELRQIAHGLRPSSLDDGLRAALDTLASPVPIPVSVDVGEDPLPDDVATTLYYVASEAIANAVKHADATHIDVAVVRSNGQVALRVSDDGRGGAVPRAGSGLVGLDDRVAAAGGSLHLLSPGGGGTVLEVVLPCGS